jgi:hypothetical protein
MKSETETKCLDVEVKDEEKGIVRARFATLGQKDLDGDVTEPGAFGTQQVQVSAYGHASWGGALPVGVGEIHEENGEAVATLKFFMDTEHGRAHFRTIKGLGDLGRWSYGFQILDSAAPTEKQREAGVVRILKKLQVHEVSPVLQAAGVGTATLDVKCDACGVGVASPASAELRSATATLAAAGRVLNGSNPGSAEKRRTADFASFCGHLLNGCPGRLREPSVKFFDPDSRPGTDGFVAPGESGVTWIASDLSDAALCKVILHESAHHGQDNPRAPAAEAEARAFAARWKGPVWASYRHSGGQPHRVRLTRNRRPPFTGTWRSGDVALQKSRGRAWVYHAGNVGSPWTTIG